MPEPIYSIYKHTSKTSGKSYIGTTINLKRRWIVHRSAAKNGSKYQFHRAFRKYGESDWVTEILYETQNEEESYDKEIEFISLFNTFKNGYNGTKGGKNPVCKGAYHRLNNKKRSKETKVKIKANHVDCSGANNLRAKHIWLKSPTGEIHKTFGTLKKFCKKQQLSYSTVTRQLRKNIKPKSGNFVGWEIWYI